jgi:hypothetical protein
MNRNYRCMYGPTYATDFSHEKQNFLVFMYGVLITGVRTALLYHMSDAWPKQSTSHALIAIFLLAQPTTETLLIHNINAWDS